MHGGTTAGTVSEPDNIAGNSRRLLWIRIMADDCAVLKRQLDITVKTDISDVKRLQLFRRR
jgi:hypothetical protein